MISSTNVKSIIQSTAPIILDLGCYDGADSVNMLNTVPNSTIYSFEADPEVCKIFENYVKTRITYPNNRLTLINKAIAATSGTITWNRSNQFKSGTILTPSGHLTRHPNVTFQTLTVESITLDDWYKNTIPDKLIDFIWCDLNGGERDLILGGADTLNNYVKYIQLECYNTILWEGQIFEQEILNSLYNFELIDKTHTDLLLKNKLLV